MSQVGNANVEAEINFEWGIKIEKVGQMHEGTQYYKSFTYEGVKYSLYDCVCLYRTGELETFIGKLVKIFENEEHEKKVMVAWFFRPIEIRNFLGDRNPRWNEIFLATGQGEGIVNINPLEALVGKCNIVCTSKDERNPQPSSAELESADYIFYRTFDVQNRRILDKFGEEIAGIKVQYFFNKKKKLINPPNLKKNLKVGAGSSGFPTKLGLDKMGPHAVKEGKCGKEVSPVVKESKKAVAGVGLQGRISNENPTSRPKTMIDKNGTEPGRISRGQVEDKAKVGFSRSFLPMSASDSLYKKRKLSLDTPCEKRKIPLDTPCEKRKLPLDGKGSISQSRGPTKGEGFKEKASKTYDKAAFEVAQDRGVKTHGQDFEVTRKPDADRRNWFKQLPWEQRLRRAEEMGTLVLLENLNPSYTSLEVEDLVWHALNEKVGAKMIQHSTNSNPDYGKAHVIFKSKPAADFAISELNRRCLILEDGRPVIGSRGTLGEPVKSEKFPGHLDLKRRHQRQRDEGSAVSTSHCSQPNTMEYELAMEWRLLQNKSDKWWNALSQKQNGEIQELRNQLKIKLNR